MIPLLGLVFARGLLAMPYRTLMPKYAQDVMGLDATGLGVLVAAPGVGSLISSLALASLGNWRGKGKLMLVSGVILGLALFGFASSQSFTLVLVLLAVVGATGNICMVTNRTLLQVGCEAPYLGRVMSAYMMMFGLTQLGTMPIGAWADWMGVPRVIAVLGAASTVTFVLVWVFLPRIRRLD
jgi:MFS family permease